MSKEPTEAAYVMSGQFTPENCALVLIDHQVGTLQFVHTMSPETSLQNAIMLAKAAKAYDMLGPAKKSAISAGLGRSQPRRVSGEEPLARTR